MFSILEDVNGAISDFSQGMCESIMNVFYEFFLVWYNIKIKWLNITL